MFKLVKLSSPSGLFKPIVFHDGLNIILGKYSKSGTDINGIGKTTIVNLIDYCLLADGVKAEFFHDKYAFIKDERVRLDFKIGENHYSIERGFKEKKEVLFQVNDRTVRDYADSDLRLILGAEIGREEKAIYDPQWFRTLMSFFIQNDHNFLARNAAQVERFTVGKRQGELLSYLFLIMGLDNNLIWSFDNTNVDLKALQGDQSRIKKQIVEQTGKSVDDFRGECDSLSRRIEKLEAGLDNYEFDQNSNDLEDQIKKLNREISNLNREHLSINSKFQDINESLKIEVDVDPESVAKFYEGIHAEFSEFIKRSLSEVLEFREQIASNRSKFLKEREAHYQDQLETIRNKVVSFEKERSKIYKMLDEKSAFDALKAAYSNLVEEKSRLSSHLTYVDQLDHIEGKIADKKSDIGKTVADIVAHKDSFIETINIIKSIFLDLVEHSVDIDASDVNPYFNIEFKSNQNSPIKIRIEVPRGGSLGKGRFKILAFDLTVFLASVEKGGNLPSFLIHDGVFHAIAHKTRIKFLNYMNTLLSQMQGVQYIITVNEDEIIFPKSEAVSVDLDFDLAEKTLITLEDKPELMFLGSEFG